MQNSTNIFVCGLFGLLLSGCGATAANYRPIVDGSEKSSYESDLISCSQLAQKRAYLNDDVKSEAALGALIGAVAGAIDGGSDDALGGAIVAGAFTAGGRAWETREERKEIVINCMQLRGHRVVG